MTIAAFALLAAEHVVDEVHLTDLAEIVASAAFDPDGDVAAARRRIDAVGRVARYSPAGSVAADPLASSAGADPPAA